MPASLERMSLCQNITWKYVLGTHLVEVSALTACASPLCSSGSERPRVVKAAAGLGRRLVSAACLILCWCSNTHCEGLGRAMTLLAWWLSLRLPDFFFPFTYCCFVPVSAACLPTFVACLLFVHYSLAVGSNAPDYQWVWRSLPGD